MGTSYEKAAVCETCGNTYIKTGRNQRSCPTCKKAERKEYMKKYSRKRYAKSKPKTKTLAELNREALEHGLSYGQYMARRENT